jgi:hypothetical protein
MSWDTEPVVGQWYRHLEKDYEFKVVAVDEDEGVVQIQYIDDEVEELDIDSWYEWDVERIAPVDRGTRTRGDAAVQQSLPEEEEEEEEEQEEEDDEDSYTDSLEEEVEDEEDDDEEDEDLGHWQDR